ncbi:efflux RND transporter periplasmic adaptor subunit [Schlesneria paludicola]|uniref:efflux RND transporter periplasmic adaptor subunit n=1 Tax=Schlesneria paludicola TaxID=360056 RepID=UPI00029A5419|nr:efflux RND transporter periplasmic adaptor subunit [Schlesneria paludicola]
MIASECSYPQCRDDLVIRGTDAGEYVVKLPRSGSYFRIGEVERFLLGELNGQQSADTICHNFQQQFGDPLSTTDLDVFISTIRPLGLMHVEPAPDVASINPPPNGVAKGAGETSTTETEQGNILFFRRTLFDPERMFQWLEPRIRFLWTQTFVALSTMAIVGAIWVTWQSKADLVSTLPKALQWQTIALFWVTMVVVTILHEFAHGLTCKHFGSEVREIGVLVAFLTPCFFCNVTDAWLIPKKWHRLWVTLAGAYCDLCIWALAVFLWRVTVQDTLVNRLAYVVLSICGGRILFNLNPLLRLDGYYLLSDWLEIPNLRQRSEIVWMQYVRWLLWGAERPRPQADGRSLVIYGFCNWLFTMAFLQVMLIGILRFMGARVGLIGLVITLLLVVLTLKRLFSGFFTSEFRTMIVSRPTRTALWGTGLAAVCSAICLVPARHIVKGDFEVRPGTRTEVHAPIAGFVKTIHHREGDRVEPEMLLLELDVPDLVSQITRKRAEVQEVQASLNRLRSGHRTEELDEQRRRISRAESWRDLAIEDLSNARTAYEQELVRLDHQVKQSETEVTYALHSVGRAAKLYRLGALADEQYRSEHKRYELSNSRLAQAKAAKIAREADGVRAAQAELARREKELEDCRSTLVIMEAGSRSEDIEAETARSDRLKEELAYLLEQQGQLKVSCPAAGIVSTPHLEERVNRLAERGSLICTIDDISKLNVEIQVAEEDVAGITPGQSIELKARALPFDTFVAEVDRIAPVAVGIPDKRQNQNMVTVYCHVANADAKLKAGMTGIARVHRGRRTLALNLINQALRYIRTEFWW